VTAPNTPPFRGWGDGGGQTSWLYPFLLHARCIVYDSTHPTWAFLTASYYRGLVAMAQERARETIALCRTAIAALPQPVRRTPRPTWSPRARRAMAGTK
jgi:hypothetical protein